MNNPRDGRHGDAATRRRGGAAMRRRGDTAARRYGDAATRRYGDTAIRRYGDAATRRGGQEGKNLPGKTKMPISAGGETVRKNELNFAFLDDFAGLTSAFVATSARGLYFGAVAALPR